MKPAQSQTGLALTSTSIPHPGLRQNSGICICKAIIDDHQGEFDFTTTERQATSFYFSLAQAS